MNNLLTNWTASPSAFTFLPSVDIFASVDLSLLVPEQLSNDNILSPETDKQLHVEIDLPGVKKKDLKVTYNEDTNLAYVKAKRNVTTKTGTTEETFTRSFRIDTGDYEGAKVSSKLSDGVLTLTVPRKVQKEHTVIDVKVD